MADEILIEDDLLRRKALALNQCTFYPGSWEKRFCRDVAAQDAYTLRQCQYIEYLYWRYRRQMKALRALPQWSDLPTPEFRDRPPKREPSTDPAPRRSSRKADSVRDRLARWEEANRAKPLAKSRPDPLPPDRVLDELRQTYQHRRPAPVPAPLLADLLAYSSSTVLRKLRRLAAAGMVQYVGTRGRNSGWVPTDVYRRTAVLQ
jgi:hypothetical protein